MSLGTIVWAAYYYFAFRNDQQFMNRKKIVRRLERLSRVFRVNLNYYSESRERIKRKRFCRKNWKVAEGSAPELSPVASLQENMQNFFHDSSHSQRPWSSIHAQSRRQQTADYLDNWALIELAKKDPARRRRFIAAVNAGAEVVFSVTNAAELYQPERCVCRSGEEFPE